MRNRLAAKRVSQYAIVRNHARTLVNDRKAAMELAEKKHKARTAANKKKRTASEAEVQAEDQDEDVIADDEASEIEDDAVPGLADEPDEIDMLPASDDEPALSDEEDEAPSAARIELEPLKLFSMSSVAFENSQYHRFKGQDPQQKEIR